MISTGSQSSSGSASSRSSSRTAPWEGQEAGLRDMFARAQGILGGEREFYPGSTVEPFDRASRLGMKRAEDRATAGSPLNTAAQTYALDSIEGRHSDPERNPQLARTGEIAARDLRRQYYGGINALGSRMEASGRTGGGGHAAGANRLDENFATGLGDMYARLYGGAYERGEDRRLASVGMASDLADTNYRDAAALRDVGAQREGRGQSVLDSMIARFNYEQDEPSRGLREYAGFLGDPIMASDARSRSKSKNRQSGSNFGFGPSATVSF